MDELENIKKLAGITSFKGYKPVTIENISHTGTEKKQIEREKNIKPGDPEWFQLWFHLPYWMGPLPTFRGRKR